MGSGAGVGSLQRVFRMKTSRTMTAFAGDSQQVMVLAIDIAQIGPHRVFFADDLKEGGMAFEATRINRAIEVRLPIRIAGAVDPTLRLSEIGNRQLKEFAASPVEISLAHFPRSDDHVHALGPRDNSTFFPGPGGLKEAVFQGAHFEPEIGIAGAKQIMIGRKTAENGIRSRKLGGEVVGGFAKAFQEGLMTFPTGRGAGIRRAIVAGRRRHGRGWLFRWEQPWAGDRLNEEERNQEPDQRAGMGTTHLIPQLSKNGKADLVPDRTGWKSPNYACRTIRSWTATKVHVGSATVNLTGICSVPPPCSNKMARLRRWLIVRNRTAVPTEFGVQIERL